MPVPHCRFESMPLPQRHARSYTTIPLVVLLLCQQSSAAAFVQQCRSCCELASPQCRCSTASCERFGRSQSCCPMGRWSSACAGCRSSLPSCCRARDQGACASHDQHADPGHACLCGQPGPEPAVPSSGGGSSQRGADRLPVDVPLSPHPPETQRGGAAGNSTVPHFFCSGLSRPVHVIHCVWLI